MMKVFIIITLVITFIAICYWVILNDAEEIDPKAPFYDDEFETEDIKNFKIREND